MRRYYNTFWRHNRNGNRYVPKQVFFYTRKYAKEYPFAVVVYNRRMDVIVHRRYKDDDEALDKGAELHERHKGYMWDVIDTRHKLGMMRRVPRVLH